MTVIPTPRGRAWRRAARLGLAAGLLAALAACAPRLQAACVDSGGLAGSPSLIPCVDKYFGSWRDDRGR